MIRKHSCLNSFNLKKDKPKSKKYPTLDWLHASFIWTNTVNSQKCFCKTEAHSWFKTALENPTTIFKKSTTLCWMSGCCHLSKKESKNSSLPQNQASSSQCVKFCKRFQGKRSQESRSWFSRTFKPVILHLNWWSTTNFSRLSIPCWRVTSRITP